MITSPHRSPAHSINGSSQVKKDIRNYIKRLKSDKIELKSFKLKIFSNFINLSTESIYQDVRRMESMISKTDSKAVSIKEDNEEIRAKEQIAPKYNVENENKRYITYSSLDN